MIVYAVIVPFALFMFLWALYFRPLAHIALLAQSAAKLASSRVARTALGKRALAQAAWPGVRAYVPIVVVALVGAAAAAGAAVLFMELALRVTIATSAVNRFDQAVWGFFAEARTPWLTSMFSAATDIGSAYGTVPVVIVTAILLFRDRQRTSGTYVIVTAAGGELLNIVLKADFARARPDLAMAITSSKWYSFPSGHAMSTFIIFGAVSYIVMRLPWPWKAKSAFLAGSTAFILLVGMSRVYLGVHWASDIAGAWTAATVWLVAVTVAFELSLRLRQRRRGERASSPAADVPDAPLAGLAPSMPPALEV